MDLEIKYNEVINLLKSGKRPQIPWSSEQINLIKTWGENALSEQNEENLKKVICLIDQSRDGRAEFENLIFQVLSTPSLPEYLLIFTLSCASKHVISHRAKNALKLPAQFIQILNSLIDNESLEIFLWLLNTFDEIGPESLIFKDRVLSKRPAWLSNFKAQERQISAKIKLLEDKWKRYEGQTF